MSSKRRVVYYVLILTAAFGSSFMVGRLLNHGGAEVTIPEQGPEIALIFIGSPNCAASVSAALPPLIEEAKTIVHQQAERRGRGFSTVGVSQSASARRGLEFLERFGDFDEVSAGRSWYNLTLLKYVYETLTGPAVTPQVVVVERILGPEATPSYRSERVLMRRTGFGSIEAWVRAGAPVPQTNDDRR